MRVSVCPAGGVFRESMTRNTEMASTGTDMITGINIEVAGVRVGRQTSRPQPHRLGRCTQDSRQTGLLSFTHSLAALGHQLRREGAHLGLVDRTLALGLLQARVVLLQRAQRVPARAKLHRRQRLRRAAPLARVDGVAVSPRCINRVVEALEDGPALEDGLAGRALLVGHHRRRNPRGRHDRRRRGAGDEAKAEGSSEGEHFRREKSSEMQGDWVHCVDACAAKSLFSKLK
mmetsp:Transcript_26427/g.77150  ORF Transcript_26427/g.77150 Transcript_26427/m.77150 type:complete len:231 (-) Transcript_26427:172-864(-)